MLTFTRGNIFNSKAQALVNPVNTVGIMGAGLAAKFKARFPAHFDAYAEACNKGLVRVGEVFVTRERSLWSKNANCYVISFPTKQHWRDPSQMEWIVGGIKHLHEFVDKQHIFSLAIPALGCGRGGLHWPDVRAVIKREFANSPVDVTVYEPGRESEA